MHGCDCFDVPDALARRGNFVTAMESRTKLAFTVVALAINVASPGILTPASVAGLSIITLLLIRVPGRLLLLRLAMPLVMAAVILLTQVFLYGKTPLFTFFLSGFAVTGYQEGLAHGLLVTARVIGGVSLVLLLSMSTPADRLFAAAAWFRVPRTFIELCLLVYRYIFVLVEELTTMKDAHRVRLGFHGWRRSISSLSMLGACLVLRACDRATRVSEAMSLRGWGAGSLMHAGVFGKRDTLTAMGLAVVLAGFYIIGAVA